jgi:NAD(P)-dependent dehydrogenase (short-subunit alcohol dehydrogenase family)
MTQFYQGKKILVTGASRGLGRCIAVEYAKAGAELILLSRTVGGLEETDDLIRAVGGKSTIIPADLKDFEAIDALGATLYKYFGGLDGFVSCAGMLGTLSPLAHAEPKAWAAVFDVNLHANYRLIRTLDPLLRQSESAHAVFVSSGIVKPDAPKAYWSSSAISKAALDMMIQIYAQECADTQIQVYGLYPGIVDTKMLQQAFPGGFQGDTQTPEHVASLLLSKLTSSAVQNGDFIDLSNS